MTIGDICSREVVVCTRPMSIEAAAGLMRRHHVGDLVGIVSADDLLDVFAEEMTALARLIAQGQRRELATRR